jgi:hypothetical protein
MFMFIHIWLILLHLIECLHTYTCIMYIYSISGKWYGRRWLYACLYVYIHIFICAYIHTFFYLFTNLCICIHTCVYIHLYMYVGGLKFILQKLAADKVGLLAVVVTYTHLLLPYCSPITPLLQPFPPLLYPYYPFPTFPITAFFLYLYVGGLNFILRNLLLTWWVWQQLLLLIPLYPLIKPYPHYPLITLLLYPYYPLIIPL